eukprot:g2427.t1
MKSAEQDSTPAFLSQEIALVSSVSSFRQNMEKRIEQHWAAKRKARDQAIAQVQREEEERRQERLRRQAERAAKKFTDIDDQIADLKDTLMIIAIISPQIRERRGCLRHSTTM